jgi:hypothetical protein
VNKKKPVDERTRRRRLYYSSGRRFLTINSMTAYCLLGVTSVPLTNPFILYRSTINKYLRLFRSLVMSLLIHPHYSASLACGAWKWDKQYIWCYIVCSSHRYVVIRLNLSTPDPTSTYFIVIQNINKHAIEDLFDIH